MDEFIRDTYLMHAETEEYHTAIKEANQIIRNALTAFPQESYVAYSGGKDSTVMLDMVLKQDPDVMVMNVDYGKAIMPRDIQQEIIANARQIGAKNLRIYPIKTKRTGTGAHFYRILFGVMQKELIQRGVRLAFVGLRSAESVIRRLKTQNGGYKWNGSLTECYPLHHLKTRDVWAYIVSNGLPYCSHYDRYATIAPWESIRFASFFDSEFDHLGSDRVDGLLMPHFKNQG